MRLDTSLNVIKNYIMLFPERSQRPPPDLTMENQYRIKMAQKVSSSNGTEVKKKMELV